MAAPPDFPAQLARSWDANADAWTRAVREGRIESRQLGTDAAMVEATLARRPRRVLDVGCGEGWLCRVLAAQGVEAVGVDGSAALIEAAREAGGGPYHVLDYAAIIAAPARLGASFDAIVCNFALLDEHPAPLLRALAARLAPAGALLIQTVHPWSACGAGAYAEGWRVERFVGFGDGFAEPMPWFFRPLGAWVRLLREAGLSVEALREPLHPETGVPLSLLFEAAPDPLGAPRANA